MKWCLQTPVYVYLIEKRSEVVFTGAQKSVRGVSRVGGWVGGGREGAGTHQRPFRKIIESYYSVATSSHSAQLPRGLGAVDSSHLALGSKARSRGGKFE